MNTAFLREELLERIALHRAEKLGGLSSSALDELRVAVRKDPDSYLEDAGDQDFSRLIDALDAFDQVRHDAEFLDDDDAYQKACDRGLEKLESACRGIMDGGRSVCLDASSMEAILRSKDLDGSLPKLTGLVDLISRTGSLFPQPGTVEGTDAWDDVMMRPALRLVDTVACIQAESGRYRHARETCEWLLSMSPSDGVGARYTLAIALARLEDEAALDELDARFGRQGNAWMHLARTLLLFKLDRIPAARRALRGYASLCRGGAYALLRPTYVEPYLPTRPPFEPGSFEEATIAVHECDPVIMDTPDFLGWAGGQDGFAEQARRFARENDLDW